MSQKDSRKRRAKIKDVIHKFSNEEFELKRKKYNGICPKCKKDVGKLNLHLDHDPPLSKVPPGFVYYLSDVFPLCKVCNSGKYNKMSERALVRLNQ